MSSLDLLSPELSRTTTKIGLSFHTSAISVIQRFTIDIVSSTVFVCSTVIDTQHSCWLGSKNDCIPQLRKLMTNKYPYASPPDGSWLLESRIIFQRTLPKHDGHFWSFGYFFPTRSSKQIECIIVGSIFLNGTCCSRRCHISYPETALKRVQSISSSRK